MTSTIKSRTWLPDPEFKTLQVKNSTETEKALNNTRSFANLVSVATGAIATVWGLAKASTQFATTTTRLATYVAAKPFALYAVPFSMVANAVRVGIEYKNLTNIKSASLNRGLVVEALITGAGLLSTIFNRVIKENSPSYSMYRDIAPYLTIAGIGIAAYNAITSYQAVNDDASKRAGESAVEGARDGLKGARDGIDRANA